MGAGLWEMNWRNSWLSFWIFWLAVPELRMPWRKNSKSLEGLPQGIIK